MRKLILGEWLSLDGFASDKNGTTAFFEDPKYGGGSDRDMLGIMQEVDTILIGRKTYEMFVAFWPEADPDKEPIADTLNATSKIVFSSTLEKAPWGKWADAKILSGNASDEIAKLKSQPGKDIIVWGSLSLARELIAAKLVDELQIRVVPVLLGQGEPLFQKSEEIKLELVENKSYDSGLTYSRYLVN